MKTDFYNLAVAQDGATLDLFGLIGGDFWGDGFTESEVAECFRGINRNAPLTVNINSQGGSVFSALAIKAMIEQHTGPVTVNVAGIAASAATVITCAKNAHVIMKAGSMLMIHMPMIDAVMAGANELRGAIERLDMITESLAGIYTAKTGMSREKVIDLMEQETFMTARQALEYGFADEVDESEEIAASLNGRLLSVNGRELDMSKLPIGNLLELTMKETKMPETVPAQSEAANTASEQLDIKALQAGHPELVKGIAEAAVLEERARIKALAEFDTDTNHEIVMRAMFDEPMSPEACAVLLVKAQAERERTAKAQIDGAGFELADTLAGVDGSVPNVAGKTEACDSFVKAVQDALKENI